MNRVAIVDFGLCNLDSIVRAVDLCGAHVKVTTEYAELSNVDSIILPGVGTFSDAMYNLIDRELDKALTEQVIGKKTPFLGICLGLHLVAVRGSERGNHKGSQKGLGWIDGEVVKLEQKLSVEQTLHIGWNEVHYAQTSELFVGVEDKTDFYFMHSYHIVCENTNNVVATTPYCGGFTSAISSQNIFGVQFHPEKSQRVGFQVLRNFLKL